jgi:HJR/Mrr/RecB family endonuclease
MLFKQTKRTSQLTDCLIDAIHDVTPDSLELLISYHFKQVAYVRYRT